MILALHCRIMSCHVIYSFIQEVFVQCLLCPDTVLGNGDMVIQRSDKLVSVFMGSIKLLRNMCIKEIITWEDR